MVTCQALDINGFLFFICGLSHIIIKSICIALIIVNQSYCAKKSVPVIEQLAVLSVCDMLDSVCFFHGIKRTNNC